MMLRTSYPMDLFSIGEFSRMSGLTVKTLRFYHEKELLIPAAVESDSGYRRYSVANLERARVIVALRKLDFGLETIAEILADHHDDADILEYLERQKARLRKEVTRRDEMLRTLNDIIELERTAKAVMKNTHYEIQEKMLEPVIIAGMRTTGRYRDCGKLFGALARKVGRHINGKAMMLCYDEEFREDDADFEPCMPLKRKIDVEGVDVRTLAGGRCITLIHGGPYDDLTGSYRRVIEYAKERGLRLATPSREVYLKGPGMIFKGNPKKYLTELQFLIEDARAG